MCIVVALLLACFSLGSAPSSSPYFKGMHTTKPAAALHADHRVMSQLNSAEAKSDQNAPDPISAAEGAIATDRQGNADKPVLGQRPRNDIIRRQSKQQQGQQRSEGSAGIVGREDIRRALASVSASYPHARPSRGSLRQVYNFLLQSKSSDMAAEARETIAP